MCNLVDGIIVFGNFAAASLLSAGMGPIAGRHLDQYFDKDPRPVIDLMAEGVIRSFESRCRLAHSGRPVTMTSRVVCAKDPTAFISAIQPVAADGVPSAGTPAGRVVEIGSADLRLVIEGGAVVSGAGGECALGAARGRSLLDWVAAEDVDRAAAWAAQAPVRGSVTGAPLTVRLKSRGNARFVLIVALRADSGGYVFTVIDTLSDAGPAEPISAAAGALGFAPPAVKIPRVTSAVARRPAGDLFARLAPREIEIVTELLNGYRAPSIARRLFLSAGTVRNHLSAAYRKLGVNGQQELIEMFRNAGAGSDGST